MSRGGEWVDYKNAPGVCFWKVLGAGAPMGEREVPPARTPSLSLPPSAPQCGAPGPLEAAGAPAQTSS